MKVIQNVKIEHQFQLDDKRKNYKIVVQML